MQILLGVLGTLFILYTLVDVLWTTFLEGGAPLTTQVCYRVARALVVLHAWPQRPLTPEAPLIARPPKNRRLIAAAGLAAVVATVNCWGLALWLGWTLLFCARTDSLVWADNGQPADFLEKVYFVGYTIFTLGLGDYHPKGHFFQLATSLCAGSGFILFGLALAYLVPVTAAATQKRQLALCIWSLGKDPGEIMIRTWNGVDNTALAPHLISLIPLLAALGENHVTYPALHYFHSTKRSSSVAPNVAALDEALSILECGLQQGCNLDLPSLGAARESITEYLNTLRPALIAPARDTPPVPSLKALRDVGIPVVDDELFKEALASLSERRRLLLAVVRNEGWSWEAVWPQP